MHYQIPEWCNRFRNIPYENRGRSFESVDCYGLVKLVNMEQFGRLVPDYVYQDSMNAPEVSATVIAGLPLDWSKVDVPEEGDLVMFNIARRPIHCGVWAAPNFMLHSVDNMPSGIERLDSLMWKNRLKGFYRPLPRT